MGVLILLVSLGCTGLALLLTPRICRRDTAFAISFDEELRLFIDCKPRWQLLAVLPSVVGALLSLSLPVFQAEHPIYLKAGLAAIIVAVVLGTLIQWFRLRSPSLLVKDRHLHYMKGERVCWKLSLLEIERIEHAEVTARIGRGSVETRLLTQECSYTLPFDFHEQDRLFAMIQRVIDAKAS